MKNGKKLLSLVLSVLMIMSCMLFAPVASAAGVTLNVKVTVTDSIAVSASGGPKMYLKVTEENGQVHTSGDVFPNLSHFFGSAQGSYTIEKGYWAQYSPTITSKVSKIEFISYTYPVYIGGNVKYDVEAWIDGGQSIINGGKVNKEFKSNSKRDQFKNGAHQLLAGSGDMYNNGYPTYLIRFLDLNGDVIKSENVSLGDSATAPALPTKASDDIYHYTVAWNKGNSAWKSVKEAADITAVATPVEHTYGGWTITKEETCTENGSKTRTCSECGYVQTQTINSTGHSYGEWETTTAATCTTAGVKTKTCSKCGNKITEKLSALGHTMVGVDKKDPTCTEPGYTWHTKCIRCDYTQDYTVIPATGHTFGDWYTVTESTCTVAGTKRRDCKNCDYFETEAAELASHTPKTVPAVPATCTETGLTEGSVCAVCGATLVAQKTVDALGHDMKETGRVDSTCIDKGVINYKCSRCDHTSTAAIPAKGHTFADDFTVTVTATCTADGEKAKLCTVCSAKDPASITVIPARGHKYGDWTVVNDATCTEEGLKKRVCTNEANDEYAACEAFETEKIAVLGHDMTETVDEKYLVSAADCVNDAVYKKSCSRCDYTEGTFAAENTALGHDFTKAIVDNAHLKSAATCEEKAVYYYNCSRCDVKSDSDTFEYGEALGHDYVGAITTRPSEDEKGLATYTCTRDASHVYTLAMDLADYSAFDASLDALKDLLKKDLNDESKAAVEAAIAEAETLSRNLIAGVKGEAYTDPLDRYKHDFGEQKLIDEAKAKIDEAIKAITDKGDEALNKYTVTFVDYDGSVISTVTVVSGKSATVPSAPVRACDDANHYAFTGWNGNYENVIKNETVVAEYKTEAHNFVENTDRYVAPSKDEDGTWTDGTVVKECTGCSCEKSESIARADYETRYDPALEKVQDILDNPELIPEVKKEIEKTLKDNNIPLPENYDTRKQEEVDKAADLLEKIIGEYTDKDGNVKDEYLKHYTITFIWKDGKATESLVKGAKIVVPTVGNYTDSATNFTFRFLGWDKTVPETVTGDATFNAKYSEPRNMDDAKEAIKDANDVINNDDYYDEDQKKVEDAKKELEDYLEDKGVDLDKGTNPVEKGSKEDQKITELVEKLREAIDNANKNKANRDNNKHQTKGFMHWLTRLLILVRHLLGMV